MHKSIKLLLGPGILGVPGPPYQPSLLIPHATCRYWQGDELCIFEQYFDGRYTLLYYYEYWLITSAELPLHASQGDIHLVYPFTPNGGIQLLRPNDKNSLQAAEGKGTYLYLAPGVHSLRLDAGHHVMVGFILDAGLFRSPANRSFTFLDELLQAKKNQAPSSLKSTDLRVAEPIHRHLEILFNKLNPYTLDNEHILLQHVVFQINLSRFLLLEDEGIIKNSAYWVSQARELLRLMIRQQGAKAKLKDVALTLNISLAHLGRLHHRIYECSLLNYRNELLLDLIRNVIFEYEKLATTAEETGFAGLSEMNRFIRGQTGLTAKQFKEKSNPLNRSL